MDSLTQFILKIAESLPAVWATFSGCCSGNGIKGGHPHRSLPGGCHPSSLCGGCSGQYSSYYSHPVLVGACFP